jgi:hypothetical protein
MSIFDKLVDAVTPPETEEQRREARRKVRAAAAGTRWLSVLVDHHEQIEAAFAEAKRAEDAGSRRVALKRLGELLNGHSIAEEATIYPALAKLGESGHADMAYAEQVAAKLQMAALEQLDPLSEDFADKLGHLEGAVRHHVYKEESGWFIDLKEKASAEDQARLAKRYSEEFDRYMEGGQRTSTDRRAAQEPRTFDDDLRR